VAVGHSVDPAEWQQAFDGVMARVAGRFGRVEPRRTARQVVLGLLSDIERKNCWWLAEHAGHGGPQAMQRLLREKVWDADQVRDDVRDPVAETLGRPDGVLIADETGVLKKGVLCRVRHNTPYADRRIMPSLRQGSPVGAAPVLSMSA
jgi:SRSO17 transposase